MPDDMTPLAGFSPNDTSAAAIANLVAHAGWAVRRTAGMLVLETSDLVLVDCGLPCDNFNVICQARLAPADADNRIRAVISHFVDAGRPFSWWLCPGDEPADLPARLESAGLDHVESEVAMAADLAGLPAAGAPDGLEIRRVRSVADLRDFATTLAAGWSPPDQDVVRFYELSAPALLAADAPQYLYVGYLDGAPVATTELTVGGGVAGLYNVSTLAEFRRRGIATSLCRDALLDARSRGFGTAVLQAQGEAGLRIYSRLGFRPFGDIAEYKLA